MALRNDLPSPAKPSKTSTAKRASSAQSSMLPSPELLLTIQRLQEELNELKAQRGMTADEKEELAQLKKDLSEAKREAASQSGNSPSSVRPRRSVNYGIFTVEEHEE